MASGPQNTGNAAPWQLRMQPEERRVRPRFDWRIVCRVCGYQKGQHESLGRAVLFGKGKCTVSVCAMCHRNKRHHDERARELGRPVGTNHYHMGENCVFF